MHLSTVIIYRDMKDCYVNIEQLFRENHGRLLRFAVSMLHDEKESEDAVSDVFAKIVEGGSRIPDTDPERYLTSCVRNRCNDIIDHLKVRQRVERGLTLQSSPSLVPPEVEARQAGALIDYAEQHLPPDTWEVFRLRFDELLNYKEIAEKMNISESQVYRHLSRALLELKEKFVRN